MPRTKKTIEKKESTKEKEPEIMEFEEFVARKSSRSKGGSKFWLYIILVVLILGLSTFLIFDLKKSKPVVEPSFKIVYLENNIVYYAKVVKEDAYNIYLSDVFYTDTQTVEKPAEEEGGKPTTEAVEVLRRRGDNSTGPLMINRQKVWAMEELPQGSKVMEMIKNYK